MGLQAEDALIIGCSIGGCLLLIAVIIIITVLVQSRCCKCCYYGTIGSKTNLRDSYTSDTYAKGMAQRTAFGGVWMSNPSMQPNPAQGPAGVAVIGRNVDKLGPDWNTQVQDSYANAESTQSLSSDPYQYFGSHDRLVESSDGFEQVYPAVRQVTKENKKTLEPNERKVLGDAFQFLEDIDGGRRP